MNEEELYLYLRKYRDNCLTAEEHARLRAWVEASPENHRLMQNFLKMYKTEAQCEAVKRIDTARAWDNIRRTHRNRRRFALYRRVAAAACIVGFVCLSTYIYMHSRTEEVVAPVVTDVMQNHGSRKATLTLADGQNIAIRDSVIAVSDFIAQERTDEEVSTRPSAPAEVKMNRVDVPRGGEFNMELPDGTMVWINAASSLSFPSRFGDTRVVELQGEAYFDVAKTGQPFLVKTADMTVRVLGTQFNVSAYAAQPAQTTLVQGGVEVANAQGKVLLKPGQQAEIRPDGAAIEVRRVNVSMYTAWMTGRFDFDDTPLEEIMAQLSRWYDIDVEFASPRLRSIRFSGTFLRKESLGYALGMISKVSDVRFEEKEAVIYVKNN